LANWSKATRHGFFFGQAGLGGVHHVQDHAAFFEVGRTCGREGQAAGAAGDEFDAEVLFQRGDLARDHRARHLQLIGHGGECARFGHTHKNLHCIEFVHCC
jgi:hypothetical protein